MQDLPDYPHTPIILKLMQNFAKIYIMYLLLIILLVAGLQLEYIIDLLNMIILSIFLELTFVLIIKYYSLKKHAANQNENSYTEIKILIFSIFY
jgi:hypothetical protein